MKPPVDTLYISQLGRDQLIKLKRQTGIEHYNVICRWAFCASLSESSVPIGDRGASTGGIAIDWRVFAGEFSDVFSALLLFRARTDGVGVDSESVAHCLRSHVHRGLGYLASDTGDIGISGFLQRWAIDRHSSSKKTNK